MQGPIQVTSCSNICVRKVLKTQTTKLQIKDQFGRVFRVLENIIEYKPQYKISRARYHLWVPTEMFKKKLENVKHHAGSQLCVPKGIFWILGKYKIYSQQANFICISRSHFCVPSNMYGKLENTKNTNHNARSKYENKQIRKQTFL